MVGQVVMEREANGETGGQGGPRTLREALS